AGYWTGTVLSAAQVTTIASYTGTGSGPPPTPAPSPTPTPVTAPINDWPTYQFDNQRSGYNPNSSAITPASIANLHAVWNVSLPNGFNTQTQPIVVTGKGPSGDPLLIVGGGSGAASAYDALHGGSPVWTSNIGQLNYGCDGATSGAVFGVQGTAVYDGAGNIYVPDTQGSAAAANGNPNGTAFVYKLNVATGAVEGSTAIAPSPLPNSGSQLEIDFVHTGLTLANGMLYAGTSSTCDITPWRGRVVAVNPASMTLASTAFMTYGQGGNFSGGGVWGWGGASVDSSGSVYIGVGNADTSATEPAGYVNASSEHVGYGEHVVKLSADLSTVLGSQFPGFTYSGASVDLDFSGTPVLFQPPGCPLIEASQGKAGEVVIYNAALNSAPVARFKLSQSNNAADYIGNPAYSKAANLLYAAVASSVPPYSPGMVAIAPTSGCTSFSVVWTAQFGPDSFAYSADVPRSAPTVTAGGVVFIGTPYTNANPGGALWALDAHTGAVLNGGQPVLITAQHIRMAPIVDGTWIWVIDNGGNLYGLNVDPAVTQSIRRRTLIQPVAPTRRR
ncbi:MAG: PQQ-binding-like beta-propeller repeat protein, partial [Vulcanimicrobiaceae bacterium]